MGGHFSISIHNLSEIARLITGTRWSGPRFFGLRRQKRDDSLAPTRGGQAKSDIIRRLQNPISTSVAKRVRNGHGL
jgi:hypothetical protein